MMVRGLSRALVVAVGGMGLMVASACTDARTDGGGTPARLGTSRELLSKDQYGFEGLDLPAKTLIFTFDDGPGSPSVVAPLLAILKDANIKATFFVNGACIADLPASLTNNQSCGEPDADATTSMQMMVADGHLIGNHTSTHRSLTGEDGPKIPANQRIEDLMFTHDLIAGYGTWNRMMFRPPFGDWQAPGNQGPGGDTTVYTALSADPTLTTYVGPVYWSIGGAITASSAADWDCWQRGWTTKKCGDLYLQEINSVGKGIILMHNAKGDTSNHNVTSGQGNTVDMVKYILPSLGGYTFKPLWEDPAIAAAFPTCNATCATCNGPSTTSCLTCAADKYLSGGACTACTTCGAGTFRATACSATADAVCATCTTCGAGTFQASACSATANAVCTTCATCPAGRHETAACSATANTVCANDDGTPIPDAGPTGTDDGGPTEPGPATNGPVATADAGGAAEDTSATSGGCVAAGSSSSVSTLGLAGLALLIQRRRRSRSARA